MAGTEDDAMVLDICKFFYPTLSAPTSVNADLKDLAATMLYEAVEQSKLLNLVPRPSGFRPGPIWLFSQAVQIFWRSQAQTKIYEMARVNVARNHRSEYELAKMGD